jgi:hypothetical protein
MREKVYAVYTSITYGAIAFEKMRNICSCSLVKTPGDFGVKSCSYSVVIDKEYVGELPQENLIGVYERQ